MSAEAARKALRLSAAALFAVLLAGCGPSTPVQKAPQRGQGAFPPPAADKAMPFVESSVTPPAYPKDSDLIEFKLRGQTANRFYIAGPTLSVAEDGVVRFVLAIRTPDEVNNVRFAGLRCADRQWKDYAFARGDHTWALAADPQWRPIQDLAFNDYQQTLYKDYFCAGGAVWSGPSGDANKLVRVLKYPPPWPTRVPR